MNSSKIISAGEIPDITKFLRWVSEAQSAHADWRAQSWQDWEFRDGKHWTAEAFQKLLAKGINPLTINRIFPIMNLVLGHFIQNQQDIIAKGRTKDDSEIAQVMSEAFATVKDQNRGSELITSAFNDQITAGFGGIEVCKNIDPRCEPVQWVRHPWYSIWWDPFASPWISKEDCRYVFTAPWKNLSDIIQAFPEKKAEILEKFSNLSGEYYVPDIYDAGTIIEDYHKYLSSNHWVNSDRKRVRPVEMWYTQITKSTFAIMQDSRVIDLDTIAVGEAFAVMQAANELVSACVKKTRVATFISDLLLQDVPSPHKHDQYPIVPFVGYLDRFNNPFGIPRQIKEQAMEVDKRRSMALSLISNRRVIIEEDAAKDVNQVYAEANRQDGLIILKKGRRGSFEIQEMASLAAPQIDLLNQSEREIQEVAGVNSEALARDSQLQSGVGLDKKEALSTATTASLMENARNSQKRLGELTLSMVQSEWTGPKVLRVTDRMSGAEKFVEINQRMYNASQGTITIQNNITEATLDIVIAAKPITDTMRDKNMELLFSAINKAPAEAIGPILNMAFEISDIPNKEALLKQVRMATGMADPNMEASPKEQEAAALQKQQQDAFQKQQQDALMAQQQQLAIEDLVSKIEERRANTDKLKKDAQRADFESGHKLGQELLKAQTERELNAEQLKLEKQKLQMGTGA